MPQIAQIVENLREYTYLKQEIKENFVNLTEEEIEQIVLESAQEANLTEEEALEMLDELFGIGSTVKRAGEAVKRVGVKVATPFKRAASFVRGVGSKIKAKSQEMDQRAAAKLSASRQATATARAKSGQAVRKSYMAGGGTSSGYAELQAKKNTARKKAASPV